MAPKSKRVPTTGIWLVAVLGLAVSGCPRNVDGEGHSGKDHRYKGAKKIKLEDGEGRSRKDIVTYPGGDRADWKVFEIPEGKIGTIKIKLGWQPPRPDLDLAFDVFDQYFHRIARAKPSPGGGKRSKRVTLRDATAGKYYVQVYAPRRIDAGAYRVTVQFKEGGELVAVATEPSDVPDPPILPAIPEAVEPPPGGEGTVPTTTQPTVTPTIETPPVAQPVKARISKYEVSSGGTLVVTVDKGRNAGIESGWKGQVVSGSGQAVRGGDFTITKVTAAESQGKVGLSVDQIKTNNKVVLSPL